MSHIHMLGSWGISPSQTKFQPFRGTGYSLNGHYTFSDYATKIPAAGQPLQERSVKSEENYDTLISHLKAAASAMEATASAMASLHLKTIHQEEEIKKLMSSISHGHPDQTPHNYPDSTTRVTVTDSICHANTKEAALHDTRLSNPPCSDPYISHVNHFMDVQPKPHSLPTEAELESAFVAKAPVLPENHSLHSPNPVTNASQIVGTALTFLQQERKEEMLQGKVKEQEKLREGDMKYALRARSYINTILSVKKLRQNSINGWNHLRQYIREVEQNCPRDSMRVAMIPLTVEQEILQLVKLDDEEALNNITWKEFKKILRKKVPKVRQWDAEMRLLKMRMTGSDDIEEFTTRIRSEYEETCHLLGLDELDLPLTEVFEFTVTANMTPEAKIVLGQPFHRDPDAAIQKIEEGFQN